MSNPDPSGLLDGLLAERSHQYELFLANLVLGDFDLTEALAQLKCSTPPVSHIHKQVENSQQFLA